MKTFPVVTSQLTAMGVAIVAMPWIMTGVRSAASSWGVDLPQDYESQLTALVSGVFSLLGAWWATRRVIAPTLTLPKVPDAE